MNIIEYQQIKLTEIFNKLSVYYLNQNKVLQSLEIAGLFLFLEFEEDTLTLEIRDASDICNVSVRLLKQLDKSRYQVSKVKEVERPMLIPLPLEHEEMILKIARLSY